VQTDNKFFDDLAKLGQSAAGTLHGVKGEFESMIRARLEHLLRGMDLVTREEFDVVCDMAKEARAENLGLAQKIAELEKMILAQKTAGSRAKTSPRTRPRTRPKISPKTDKDTKK